MKHLLPFLLLAPLFVFAQSLTLFEATEKEVRLLTPDSRPSDMLITKRDNRTILRITQEAAKGNFMEFELPPHRRIPDCRRLKLYVEAYLPEIAGITRLNPRFRDGKGEIFQIPLALTSLKPGWQTLVYELDTTAKLKESWGRDDNHVIDYPLSFIGFAGSSASPKQNRSLELARITVEAFDARILLDVDTNCPVHVLQPQDDDKLALTLTSQSAAPVGFKGTCRYTDGWGNVLAEAIDLNCTISPHAPVRVPLKSPTTYGVFYLDITGQDPLGPVSRRFSFCRMIPAGPTPGHNHSFIFGAHYHAFRYSQKDNEKDMLAAALCGVKCFRVGAAWSAIQRKADAPIDFARYEAVLDRCDKYGLEVQPIFGSAPSWAVDKDWKPLKADYRSRLGHRGSPAPDLKAWKTFVTAFMTHFRGRIRFVESWNEPDLYSFANFPIETYINIQKTFYECVKAVAPEAIVLTGGYACLKMAAERSPHPDFLRKSLDETRGYFDVNAFHAHGAQTGYVPQIIGLRHLHHDLKMNVAWWANETATTSTGNSELTQAGSLFTKLLYTYAMGGIGYNWYDLRNDGYDPKEPEHNFGMLTRDFYPKAVYATYNTLATWFRDASFHREFPIADGFQAYLFQAENGDFLIPCWHIRYKQPSRPLTIINLDEAAKLSRIDLFGNETPMQFTEGIAFVESTDRPVFFRVHGQLKQPLLLNSLVTVPEQLAFHPLHPTPVTITIVNPFDTPLKGALTVKPLDGFTVDHAVSTLDIPASTSHELKLNVTCTAPVHHRKSAEATLDIELSIGEHLILQNQLHLKKIQLINTQRDPAVPDFVINRVDNLRSLIVNEPATSHLVWKGPEDCSARTWLTHTDDALVIDVEVTDDTHVQTFTAQNIWKGDSVQFALVLDGQSRNWEIGLSRLPDKDYIYIWGVPKGFNGVTARDMMTLKTERDDKAHLTRYHAVIPFKAVGLTHENARQGFPFNLIVNDNDTDMRESYIFITPGLGSGFNSKHYPVIAIEK